MNEQTNHIKSKIHKIKHIKRGTSVSAILHILTFKKNYCMCGTQNCHSSPSVSLNKTLLRGFESSLS